MKKFLFAVALMLSATFANAQSTSPRFATTNSGDNTYRGLSLSYTSVTDAVGADTTTLRTNKFTNYVRVALVDSLTLTPVVTSCKAGDELVVIATGTSGNKLKFTGTAFQSAGTATLSTGTTAVLTFVFTGAKWAEKSRIVQ